MDSGTSGSMQSSSGGDEEQESHAYTSISPCLNGNNGSNNNSPSNNFGPRLSNPNNCYLYTSQDLFSSHTNNLNRSSFPGLDPVWSRSTLPSVPNSTSSTLQNLVGSSSITPKSMLVSQANHHSFPSSSSEMLQSDHHNNSVPLPEKPVARNPKKRTRASRRAPTAVMVTDTANFRSMVQEFTGIPAPPFPGSPYSSSRRLDLFGTAGGRSSHLEQLGNLYHHPLKPSAHKSLTNPFVPSSSLPNINLWDSSVNKYQIPSDQPNMLQNPNLSFRSLLQSPNFGSNSLGNYSSGEVPVVGGANKSQVNSLYNGISLNQDMGLLDQNIRQHINGTSDLGGNDGRSEDNVTNWREGGNNHSVEAREKFG